MAPVCVACRQLLSELCVLFVIVSILTLDVDSLLVYDRQTLLDLCSVDLAGGGRGTLPPLLARAPVRLCLVLAPLPRRKRKRRRGKRGGRLVRLKACLASLPVSSWTGIGRSLILPRRSLDPDGCCLLPAVGPEELLLPCGPSSPRPRRRGLNLLNLRPLCRAPLTSDAVDQPVPVKIALVNARSLVNKTFILKDFFESRGLDLLCVTETWLGVGESSAFAEMLPLDCCYLNSPRTSGRGGGLATVFRSHFKCKQLLLSSSLASFELSLFELVGSNTVLCALVYRPPKYNKDFLNDFSIFLAEIMPRYDRVLIVGDFNVHVCCPEKPMAKDFLNLIDSFSLVQSVSGPTQEHGHTLDLVLSYGLPVSNLVICDAVFSDHMPVLFEVIIAPTAVRPRAPARHCRVVSPSTAVQFSAAFALNSIVPESVCDTEELSSWLHSTCQTVLDTVAPLKFRQPKTKFEPWMNDTTRAVRRECRRAERKWKKDKLQVSFQMLRESWCHYQKVVKAAKRKHFSGQMISCS
ncbi:uncharacterized protein LOC129709775 [Leucoraja erinacea]|uniref:uncharacterized protein LOC129709775 n=1 Tax=Leucoraja erinaceus TaxID=7782 RepID=UPI002458C6A4|nr:uncharacterized protein LOC129709775 [Leucoraja erinacea]